MRRLTRWSVLTSVALLAAGCASHKIVPSEGPRPPTRSDQVKLYQDHPKKYSQLGTVELVMTPQLAWDNRGDATAAFDAMKAKAAALGANGLLFLLAEPARPEFWVTAGYHGTYYQVPMRHTPRTAMAQAIWVIEEK